MSSNQICGYISLLYSVADKPLELWSKHVSLGGKIRRVTDDTLHGDKVIEILGPHNSVVPTSITAPAKTVDTLNIRLAVLVLIIKNLKSRFKLEVQITDKKQYRRRFSFVTYNLEKLPSVNASVARIPLKLEEYWNILEINLQTLCRTAYGTDYEALQRIIVYPNCRLRRVYLQDRHYEYDETPVELCNAFFNTYMSKWGINFAEKTSQTEECYTGSSKECDSNILASNSKVTVPQTKADLFQDVDNTDRFWAITNPKVLKRNYVSLDTLNGKTKMCNNQNVCVIKRRSWSRTQSLISEAIMRNKQKETSNDITEKLGNKEITQSTWNANPLKLNNHMLYSASPVGTSQFLKMHVKTLFQNNFQNIPELPKCLYPYKIRCSKDISVIQRSNVNPITNTKFGISVANFPLASKPNLSRNIGFNRNQMSKDIIVSNNKYVKTNTKTTNGLRSLITVEKSVDSCVPYSIEKVAKLDNVKPRSMRLTKDKSDLMSVRSLVNRRFFEKLQDKGLVKQQVELSTYNMVN